MNIDMTMKNAKRVKFKTNIVNAALNIQVLK